MSEQTKDRNLEIADVIGEGIRLCRFTNTDGVEYSAIYEGDFEAMSCERDKEQDMILAYCGMKNQPGEQLVDKHFISVEEITGVLGQLMEKVYLGPVLYAQVYDMYMRANKQLAGEKTEREWSHIDLRGSFDVEGTLVIDGIDDVSTAGKKIVIRDDSFEREYLANND